MESDKNKLINGDKLKNVKSLSFIRDICIFKTKKIEVLLFSIQIWLVIFIA
jgi:hypothetical protein